ncbi:hypothetical protein [Ferrimonas pelagia]|uniref:Uncharacterized protein n=1 Tax=Ferrimonas pelagia TaxID=1177826 RepID=A0ABP9FD23_9GAMM
MGWLTGYALMGTVVFLTIWVGNHWQRHGFAPSASWQVLQREWQRRRRRPGLALWEATISLALGVLLWPLLLLDALTQLTTPAKPVAFVVKPEYLREPVSIDTLERRATDDPNSRFNPLNPDWLEFKQQQKPGDAVWSFEAQWQSMHDAAQTQQVKGYVLLRQEQPIAHVCTEVRDDDEA